MATRISSTASTVASLLVAQAHSRARTAITTTRLAQHTHSYSSLRRPARSLGSARGGRITARTTAPSRAGAISNNSSPVASEAATPLAGAASTLDPHILNTSQSFAQDQDPKSEVVQGLDIAATPAVVPDDPFGVLQPYDTAAKLLTQPALIMTRQIEMMNVLVGFEQANKYAIVDPSGEPIGYIAEEDTTMVKAMSRQLLRTHRPFKASVLDLEGNEVLKIHRPFAFINSRIMISTPDDRLIGEVQQEWHLVRRKYNLFTIEQPDPSTIEKDISTIAISKERAVDGQGLDRVQFAHIDGGFLALDFDMQDEQGRPMASVNRNFVGFARELFTDSGQYALRFDAAVIQDIQQEQSLGATTATATTASSPGAPSTAADSRENLQEAKEIQATKDERALAQLESRGGLTLDQRAIMLACAVSIDFDYFSRHSGNGGIMPFPMMMGGGGGQAPVPSSSSDNPVGTVIGAGAGAGAGQVLGGAAGAGAGAGDVAGGAAGGMPSAPMPSTPAAGGNGWGDDLPAGGATNDWGEEVWAEDNGDSGDSGDSWFGGGGNNSGGGGGGEGGGFDWGDLL
ncbi:MAG: Scramblase-domain-containing protein [Linnemannia elongata]|nr:MAG: Scramblase-domain-containing protein [Linnemannia elongata]